MKSPYTLVHTFSNLSYISAISIYIKYKNKTTYLDVDKYETIKKILFLKGITLSTIDKKLDNFFTGEEEIELDKTTYNLIKSLIDKNIKN